jgi:hypothetical protein
VAVQKKPAGDEIASTLTNGPTHAMMKVLTQQLAELKDIKEELGSLRVRYSVLAGTGWHRAIVCMSNC